MEHLLLGGVPAGDELDVVHEEDIRRPVFVPELLVLACPNVPDELVGKVLSPDVDNFIVWMIFMDGVGDGVEQMGFAQAGFPVDEEGVVIFRRMLRHRQGGGVGQFVGVAHHEPFKGVLLRPRQKAGDRLPFAILLLLLLAENHHLQLRGEEIIEGLLDIPYIPGGHDFPLKVRGHV